MPPTVALDRQAKLLVEVAVVQVAAPVHADEAAAHHAFEVAGRVVLLEQSHVRLEAALRDQHRAEALDRHVGEHEQPVEHDAEVLEQLALVVRLERDLIGRQHRALRVVDQVQHQAGARATVAERVELLERRDALVEHPLAALAIDVVDRVARQRGDDLDALAGEELREVLLAGLEQDRQVAAVDHLDVEAARLGYQPAEPFVQLRRAAREVERAYVAGPEHVGNPPERVPIHHLGAVRTGVDVAMHAALVAAIAEVDLQGLEDPAPQRGKVGRLEQGQCCVHGIPESPVC